MLIARALLSMSLFVSLTAQADSGFADRFSGGSCISQGTWLRAALEQTETITGAIQALRHDPNCNVLIQAMESAPKYTPDVGDNDTSSFVNTAAELRALSEYMRPVRNGLDKESFKTGLDNSRFKSIVFNMVFNKSYKAIKDVHNQADMSKLSDAQREAVQNVSQRLKSFLQRSKDVTNFSISTTRNILNALPQSKLCLDNAPSQGAAIFGALAQMTTAVATGGNVNGVGELIAGLLKYSREMNYINALAPLEIARYQNSISCLVESTAEAYCAVTDAEDSLAFLKNHNPVVERQTKIDEVIQNPTKDIVANPLAGLVIMMRDMPILQAWMQKILFGIDPRLIVEANYKNDNWQSYVTFLKQTNSILGMFKDREQLYFESGGDKDNKTKINQVRDIHSKVLESMGIGGFRNGGGESINFFERAMQPEFLRFFLLGYDTIPADLYSGEKTKAITGFEQKFDAWWVDNADTESGIFKNADEMVTSIRNRLPLLIEKAQTEANGFFSKRMIVDPQNLLSEATKGPGITPLAAFENIKKYYENLIVKLEKSAASIKNDSKQELRARQMLSQIPMLKNSISRLKIIIEALDSIRSNQFEDVEKAKLESEKVMGIIYGAAYMLIARDSFFSTRMQTAVQADLADTLWNNPNLTERQTDYLYTIAPDIVSRLSGFYSTNPVLQRGDISAAKHIHVTNLASVEQLFAKVLYKQIIDLDCKLFGKDYCKWQSTGYVDPTANSTVGFGSTSPQNTDLIERTNADGTPKKVSFLDKLRGRGAEPTEDASSYHFLRGKLCMQALAFETRDKFQGVCRGAVLRSEFSEDQDSHGLNMTFEKQLELITKTKASTQTAGKIDNARTAGVCSFRTYLRKNHIFYMYQEASRQ